MSVTKIILRCTVRKTSKSFLQVYLQDLWEINYYMYLHRLISAESTVDIQLDSRQVHKRIIPCSTNNDIISGARYRTYSSEIENKVAGADLFTINAQVSLIILIIILTQFINYRRNFPWKCNSSYQITLFLVQIPCMVRMYVIPFTYLTFY